MMTKRKQKRKQDVGQKRLFQVFRHHSGTTLVNLEVEPKSGPGFDFVGEVYAEGFLAAHVAVLGELPLLDDAIKPLVVLINELGFWTEFSCSGHEEKNGGNRGYILVYNERAETLLRLKRLLADIWDEEDGPCDCEGACDFIDGHPPVRSLRNGTPIPVPNMGVRLELTVEGAFHGEWGFRIDFLGYERSLTALDYAWLVEQIELRTGRAKPLPQPLHPQPLQGRKRLLTIQRLL
mgnify:FL=1